MAGQILGNNVMMVISSLVIVVVLSVRLKMGTCALPFSLQFALSSSLAMMAPLILPLNNVMMAILMMRMDATSNAKLKMDGGVQVRLEDPLPAL